MSSFFFKKKHINKVKIASDKNLTQLNKLYSLEKIRERSIIMLGNN